MKTKKLRARHGRGQTVVETAFVLSMLIFMTFALLSLGTLLHTKMVATYATFMAARSFQVLGDGTGADAFYETTTGEIGQYQRFLQEMEESKNPAFVRVAEDIFTCALPWMNAPREDVLENQSTNNQERTIEERCMSAKRKYDTLNIGDMAFIPFDPNQDELKEKNGEVTGMETVLGGFSEKGRDPLRYGVLKLPYRTPIIFDFFNLTGGQLSQGEIFVPVLLNPGLRIKLKKAEDGDPNADFKNSALKEQKQPTQSNSSSSQSGEN